MEQLVVSSNSTEIRKLRDKLYATVDIVNILRDRGIDALRNTLVPADERSVISAYARIYLIE